MNIPAEWLRASFSRANTTREQKAAVAEVQERLRVWPPDGLPGLALWEACQHHPHGERFAAKVTSVLTGSCAHDDAVPVEAVGDALRGREVVAWLCPECDTQLPADWQ